MSDNSVIMKADNEPNPENVKQYEASKDNFNNFINIMQEGEKIGLKGNITSMEKNQPNIFLAPKKSTIKSTQ